MLQKSCTSVPGTCPGRETDACREAEDEMMGWESAISHSSDRIASNRTISQHQRACDCDCDVSTPYRLDGRDSLMNISSPTHSLFMQVSIRSL